MRWWLAAAATALVVFAARHVDLDLLRRGVQAASGPWLLAAVGAYGSIQLLGAAQWRALLAESVPLAWTRLLRLFALTSVANNTTNSVIGHVAGVALVAAEPAVGKRTAVSLLVLDQLCVGIAKLVVLLLAASAAPLPTWIQRGVAWLALAPVLIVGGALVLRKWPTVLQGYTIQSVAPTRVAVAIACALGVRCAEAGAILAVHLSLGIPLSLATVVSVLAALSVATLIPVVPANLGVYEGAVFLTLRHVGISPELALLAAAVQHACQWLVAVAPGAMLLWIPSRRLA